MCPHLEQPSNHILNLGLPPCLLLNLLLKSIGIRLKIHLLQLDSLCLFQELPPKVHDQHDGKFNVEADEADAVKLGAEAAPALHQDEEAVEDDAEPWAVGVGPVAEGEEVRFALNFKGGAEADGCDADGDPAQLVRHADDAARC